MAATHRLLYMHRYRYMHPSTLPFMCRSRAPAMVREAITDPNIDTPGAMDTNVVADMEGAAVTDDPFTGRNGEAPGPPFRSGLFQAE